MDAPAVVPVDGAGGRLRHAALPSAASTAAAVTRAVLTVYVEVMRGTPILLQLFVIYYGLAAVVRLPAFVAALLGLGPELRRLRERDLSRRARSDSARAARSRAQVLGLTRRQILWLVRGPQALRIALAPMTNDFVAMLKDSSLVSVITVVELTKQTQIFATNLGSWVMPGRALRRAVSRDVAAAGAPRPAAGGRWKAPTECMTPVVERARSAAAARHARRAPRRDVRRVARGEIVALMGLSGAGQDHGSARRRRPRAVRRECGHVRRRRAAAGPEARRPRAAAPGASAWCSSSTASSSICRRVDNVCLAPVHVHRTSRARRPQRAGARAARAARRRASRDARCRANCPAAKRSASRSPARWRWIRRCCCSTSRRRRSIRRGAARSATTLTALAAEGRAILPTSHDVDFVRDHATRVVILADGQVVEAGDPRSRPRIAPARRHPRACFNSDRTQDRDPRRFNQAGGGRARDIVAAVRLSECP